tara:strand:- start:565 stop:708 length:144 start_codon:yes stop_codon:yes gene_type:complete
VKSNQKKELAICAATIIIVWVLLFTASCYVEQMNIKVPVTDNNQTQE